MIQQRAERGGNLPLSPLQIRKMSFKKTGKKATLPLSNTCCQEGSVNRSLTGWNRGQTLVLVPLSQVKCSLSSEDPHARENGFVGIFLLAVNSVCPNGQEPGSSRDGITLSISYPGDVLFLVKGKKPFNSRS